MTQANDDIDTAANTSNNDLSPFKAVINDMYAKDISKKIRSTFDTKRKNGEFIGAFAPYGYAGVIIGTKHTKPVNTRI